MFDFFKKRNYTATIQPAGRSLMVKGGQRLLSAALDAGLNWPHDCRVGSCGTCRCLLKSGRIKPLTDFVYTLSPEDIRQGVILACQSLLKSDVEVEVALADGALAREEVSGTITGLRALTHDIVELSVTLQRPSFRAVRAGQYLDIVTPLLGEARSYSLARAPAAGDGTTVSFFIRHVPGGEFTDWLFATERLGERLSLRGPFGMFHRRLGTGRMICIAGGSGLAPVHAVLEDAVLAGDTRDCVVLFGARAQRDLYYMDELAALGQAWAGRFKLTAVLSDEPHDSNWRGERGLVTDAINKASGTERFESADQAYLCGPPAMVDAAIARLNTMGMAEHNIFFDKFLDASTQPGGRHGLK